MVGDMADHPRDARGRQLPDCTWPAAKAAPKEFDVLRRFCNTCNHESGADRFETIDGTRSWLIEWSLIDGSLPLVESDRRQLVEAREHLRGHALAHHDDGAGSTFALALDPFFTDAEITLEVIDGQLTARPAGHDAAGLLIGHLAVAIMAAQRSQRWRRLKSCPSCGWVFYDHSKNRSGRWCSMSACGGRAKVAAFRERQQRPTP